MVGLKSGIRCKEHLWVMDILIYQKGISKKMFFL
jgi:hypothetical protein